MLFVTISYVFSTTVRTSWTFLSLVFRNPNGFWLSPVTHFLKIPICLLRLFTARVFLCLTPLRMVFNSTTLAVPWIPTSIQDIVVKEIGTKNGKNRGTRGIKTAESITLAVGYVSLFQLSLGREILRIFNLWIHLNGTTHKGIEYNTMISKH